MKKAVTVFLSFAVCLCVWQCGKAPPLVPDVRTGSIRIAGMDTLTIPGIDVMLDDEYLGRRANPCLLQDIAIGTHKVHIFTEAASGTTKFVDVVENSVSAVSFWLRTVGPYTGNTAPAFTAVDHQGRTVTSAGLQGKVVLLVFFEHT